jgi:hypothetical protein
MRQGSQIVHPAQPQPPVASLSPQSYAALNTFHLPQTRHGTHHKPVLIARYNPAMTLQDSFQIVATVLASLGGGGAIVFGLSSYLGKVWADRGLEKQRYEYSQLNLAFQSQLEQTTRRLQVELDALSLVHKLRTQEEFARVGELWKHVAIVRDCFAGLGAFSISFENREEMRRWHAEAREKFDTSLNEARTFLAQSGLLIPKHICRAAEAAMNVATEEQLNYVIHSDSLEASFNTVPDAGATATRDDRQEYLWNKKEGFKKFTSETEHLETLMRQHLAGAKPS